MLYKKNPKKTAFNLQSNPYIGVTPSMPLRILQSTLKSCARMALEASHYYTEVFRRRSWCWWWAGFLLSCGGCLRFIFIHFPILTCLLLPALQEQKNRDPQNPWDTGWVPSPLRLTTAWQLSLAVSKPHLQVYELLWV